MPARLEFDGVQHHKHLGREPRRAVVKIDSLRIAVKDDERVVGIFVVTPVSQP
jgi:hypothetical protein